MANALFAFENCEAGESAAHELTKRGLAPAAVQVHFDTAKRPGHSGRDIDEQITGGLMGNLLDLFRGVMEWVASPHDASSFEETVRRGGSVVSVEAGSVEEERLADEVMQDAACDRRTPWSDAPAS